MLSFIIKYKKYIFISLIVILISSISFYIGSSLVQSKFDSYVLEQSEKHNKELKSVIDKANKQSEIDKSLNIEANKKITELTYNLKESQSKLNKLTDKEIYSTCELDEDTFNFLNASLK